MSRIPLAISTGSTFHILFSANFSGVKLPPVLQHIILLALFPFFFFFVRVEEIQLRCKGTLQFSFSLQSVSLLFQCFCHMLQTSLGNDSESRAPRPLKRETTSVADISSFLSKWKGEAGWDGASTLSTAYTRHFRVGCHACLKALFPPALLFHTVYGVSLCGTAASGSDQQRNDSGLC